MTANLHLTRIQLAQVRKFDALRLDGLDPGLNIIAGPNGAGKSTVARAIRAAFLDRHGSSSAADLRPQGNSGAAPSVELDFVLQGVPYQLQKTFLKKERADLRWERQALDGQEAEDYLAERIGFAFAAKGPSKADRWGVPGLLWVEQGSDPGDLAARVGHASQRLGAALHASQGDEAQPASALAATAGDALIAQLQAELAQYWGANDKPVKAYKALLDQIGEQQAQLAQQRAHIDQYRSQVDELDRLQDEEQQAAAQPPDQAWRGELAAARARLAELEQLKQAQADNEARLAALQTQRDLLAHALQRHDEQQRQWAQRQDAVRSAEAAHQDALQQHAQASSQWERAGQQRSAALATQQQAEAARQHAELQARLAQAAADSARLQAAHGQVQELLQKLKQMALAMSGLQVKKADAQQLRKLEDAVWQARMQRDATATQVQFALPAGQSLPWRTAEAQGQWAAQGQQWLSGATTLQLPGGGELTITPGGQGVLDAAQQLAQAEAGLQAALQRHGVASAAEAQQRWEQRQALEAEQQQAQAVLAAHAPQGAEALALALEQARARHQALQQQALPAPDAADLPDWHSAQAALDQAQQALEQAQQAREQAERERVLAEQRWRNAEQEAALARAQLDDPAARDRHAHTQREAALLQAALAELQQRIAQQAAAQQPGEAGFVQQDIERLARSIAAHEQQQRERQARIAWLRAALEAAGAQGLEEASAQLEGAIAAQQRRAGEIGRRAQALHTVVTRLQAKRAAALRRLQAPLESRLQHYLQLLLPGGRIVLSEQLVPQQVQAPAGSGADAARLAGELAELSYGTQEQLGILSRLAYADLLRAAGQPTLLMFDDALVHSDRQRLAQMKRVLYDASTRHQLLLFTCHPEWWNDMGVPVRTLDEKGNP
ncbi:MAG: AAA family ATPase [Comamonas sp.]